MLHPKEISIAEYNYHLPAEKIAAFPLQERDTSKLLVYKNDEIKQDTYQHIANYLPENALLIFNNTKVIQARILFQKESGGIIEIFCLEPNEEQNGYSTVMSKKNSVRWKCMIGGASKWKTGGLQKNITAENNRYGNTAINLTATLVEKLPEAYIVAFSWNDPTIIFAEVLDLFGDTPLPPYIKRKAESTDKERYQTIYATHEGSVAAPTAGLHFTDKIFASFTDKNITHAFVTLHVSAGTFKPVKATSMQEHEMHAEWIDVNIDTIQTIIKNLEGSIVAVGTTSVRTIETLYWMGVKTILFNKSTIEELTIHQWDVYEHSLSKTNFSAKDALISLLNWMQKNNSSRIVTITKLLIAPGYKYRIVKAIVTNFHQPQSTLLLLVAAAVGNYWKRMYQYALDNNFRFLSYGDGSLIYINNHQ